MEVSLLIKAHFAFRVLKEKLYKHTPKIKTTELHSLLPALVLAQQEKLLFFFFFLNEGNVSLTYILLPVHIQCKTTDGILKYPLKDSRGKDESRLHAELLFSQLHHGFHPTAELACAGTLAIAHRCFHTESGEVWFGLGCCEWPCNWLNAFKQTVRWKTSYSSYHSFLAWGWSGVFFGFFCLVFLLLLYFFFLSLYIAIMCFF